MIAELTEQLEGIFECNLGTVHHFSDGLYAKEMHIPAGYVAGMHKHTYSHMSILAKGRVILQTEDYNREYSAPACINMLANVDHMITALEDSVWFCVHSTEETDVEKIDKVLIGR